MTTTVTNAITDFILQESRSYQFLTVSLTAIMLMVVLLIMKEGIRASGRSNLYKEISVLNVFIIPLLLVFVFLIAVRFNDILQYDW